MVTCPECDSPLGYEEDELEEGDLISCDECGAELRVVGIDPLELELAEEEDEEDEDLLDVDEDEEEDEDWR
jgi:alpha-aminoadipate carrier protein LysW